MPFVSETAFFEWHLLQEAVFVKGELITDVSPLCIIAGYFPANEIDSVV